MQARMKVLIVCLVSVSLAGIIGIVFLLDRPFLDYRQDAARMLVQSYGWEIDKSDEIYAEYYTLQDSIGIYNAAIYSGMPYNLSGIEFDLSSIYSDQTASHSQSLFSAEKDVASFSFKINGFSLNEIPLTCEIVFWGNQLGVARIDVDLNFIPVELSSIDWDNAPRHMWPIDIDKQVLLAEYADFSTYLQSTVGT